MSRSLVLVALTIALASCGRTPGDPPPRSFLRGGVWFPAATGYWFHQYAERDEIERLMQDLAFTCNEATKADETRLRCERGFRMPGGVLSRTDYVQFGFRRSGAVASAESDCRYAFFDAPSLSGTCAPFAASGAVYPNVATFAAMAEAMLRPLPPHQPISMFVLTRGGLAAMEDANALVDRLARWRFECETPIHRYTSGFRGNAGEILDLHCRQWSLHTPTSKPQSQEVVVRYDSVDLAVLGVTARLDGVAAPLSPLLNTPRDASARGTETYSARGVPTSITLETVSGERFEMPLSAVGTGSRQATREGFVALTPESQRLLIQTYLGKQYRQWGGKIDRLSHASLGALEWYGPDALPHLDALVSDERPELGAAVLRYRCFEVNLGSGQPFDAERLARTMADCIDERRVALPQSIVAMDRLLAQDLRVLEGSDARALNAFFDFKRDVIYLYALGPDGKESAAALEATVAGKDGLDASLASLVASALAQRDRPLRQR